MYFRNLWLSDGELSPAVQDMSDFYHKEYARKFGRGVGKGLYKKDDWSRIDWAFRQSRQAGGRALDVGAGPGALLNLLHAAPEIERAIGVDKNPSYRTLLKTSDDLDLRVMSVTDMAFDDDAFDIVFCMEVLEHLSASERTQALSELRRVCAGRLIMTVPFREPEPLPSYHLARFDYDDIAEIFPDGEYHILVRGRGVAWLAVIEEHA